MADTTRQILEKIAAQMEKAGPSSRAVDVIFFECMDGRVNTCLITRSEDAGVVTFSSMGAIFQWTRDFRSALHDEFDRIRSEGKECLMFFTYHWSKTEKEYGCRAFDDDVEKARAYADQFTAELRRIFGQEVYVALACIDTDVDGLTLIGQSGELDMSQHPESNSEVLAQEIARILPDAPAKIQAEILRLLLGNQAHMKTVVDRPVADLKHGERGILLGSGIQVHAHNLVLSIGSYSDDLRTQIHNAAKILQKNLAASPEIAEAGIVLMTSAPYSGDGIHRNLAIEEAQYLANLLLEEVLKAVGDDQKFLDALTVLPCILDEHSLHLEELPFDPA